MLATLHKTISYDLSTDDWRVLQERHLPGYDPYASALAGQYFCASTANAVLNFFLGGLQLVEDKWAGKPFDPEDWEKAILGALFGWKNADALRRYREAMIYVPRGNGKTVICAGLVLYGLFAL